MSFATPQKVLLSWVYPTTSLTGQLIIDATLNEQHGVQSEIATHPVETGSDVTDNIRTLPRKLTLEGMITNFPLGLPETYANGVTGSIRAVQRTVKGQTVSYTAFQFDGSFDRVRDVFGDIADAIQAGCLFHAVTTLASYDNLVVLNLAVPRSAKETQLHFTMDLQALRFVDTQTVAPLAGKQTKAHKGSKAPIQLDTFVGPQRAKSAAAAFADKATK